MFFLLIFTSVHHSSFQKTVFSRRKRAKEKEKLAGRKKTRSRQKQNNNNKNASVLHSSRYGVNLSGGRRRRPKRDVGVRGAGAAGGNGGEAVDVCGRGTAEGVTWDVTDGELEEVGGGADISGGKKGLSRSTDTVQGFPERDRTKVLSPRSSTS